MTASGATRTHGLDTLRALAITLVFMYHYMVFVSHATTFGWLSEIGWVGVDLFFVLSGYLIGNQLSAGAVRGARLSLTAFYVRRALRTWPAFWVVLAAYFLFPAAMGGKAPPPLWTFLTFTQNIGLQPGTAFSHAWSLCIEEQFYLVLPLAFLAARRLGSRRWQAWASFAVLTAAAIGLRTVLWLAYGREAGGQIGKYYPWVYYGSLCRFDEFLPGLAVALLRNLHPDAWRRLMAHGRWLFAAGLTATLLVLTATWHWYYIDGYGYGFFMSAVGYSLIAWCFGLLVLAALSPSSPLHGWRIPGAASLALWSYSIYLTHKPLAYMIQGAYARAGLPPAALLPVIVVACLAVGAASYRWIEQPFMRWRERRWPGNFDAPTVRAVPVARGA